MAIRLGRSVSNVGPYPMPHPAARSATRTGRACRESAGRSRAANPAGRWSARGSSRGNAVDGQPRADAVVGGQTASLGQETRARGRMPGRQADPRRPQGRRSGLETPQLTFGALSVLWRLQVGPQAGHDRVTVRVDGSGRTDDRLGQESAATETGLHLEFDPQAA